MRNIARNYFDSGNTENMSTFNRLCGLHTDSVYTYQYIVWRQLRPYCSFTPIHRSVWCAHAWKNSNEELQKKRITWKTHKQCELRRRRKKCEEHKNKNALERYTLCMCFLLDFIISIIFFFWQVTVYYHYEWTLKFSKPTIHSSRTHLNLCQCPSGLVWLGPVNGFSK